MLAGFDVDCTGDVCVHDEIVFTEAVWGGPRAKPVLLGERRIFARVLRESYGEKKQQHTFTLLVLASDGYEPLMEGAEILRKGRNIYRNGTMRRAWDSEAVRAAELFLKRGRGDAARRARDARRVGL